jgi:hypothetical protein
LISPIANLSQRTMPATRAMIDSLGEVGAALKDAKPESLERLYRELRLELRYQPHERAVDVQLAPRVVSACVRGGN